MMSDEPLASKSEPDRTFSAILADAQAITGAPIAALYRTDLATQRLVRVASVGVTDPLLSPPWAPLGVGLVGRCGTSGEVVLSEDIATDAHHANYWSLKQLGIRSALAVPLQFQRSTIGVIGALHVEPGRFTQEHADRLAAFAADVAPTVEKLWRWQDEGASLSQVKDPRWLYQLRLDRVRELGVLIHSLDDIDQVIDCALEAMAELTWASRVFIALVDEEAGVIRAHRGINVSPELMAETVRKLYSAPSPEEDILAYVARTRTPTFTRVGDPRLNSGTAARHGASRYALTVPLIGRSGLLGTLTAGWNHESLFDPLLLRITTILADHLAAAMETHRLVQRERRQRIVAEELHVVARKITAGLSLEEGLSAVIRAVEKLLGAASASVYLAEPSGLLPERRYTTRYTGEPHWEDRRNRISRHGPTATALRTGKPVVIDDLQSEVDLRQFDSEDIRTVAAVPVFHDERIIGVLYANWSTRRRCDRSDIQLLETLAAYGAVAIENARLHDRLVKEARLEEANRRAEEAVEARLRLQEFMAMISHDLKGPLAIVLGYAQLIRQRAGEAGDQNDLLAARGIEKAARRTLGLLDDLLDAAQIGAGRFRAQPVETDLIDLARQVVEEQRSTTTTHQISLEAPEHLDGYWDAQRIGQVLTNLISNAIKYSPDGGEVRVTVQAEDDEVKICVADQGPGIEPENIPHLFHPFFRAKSPRPTKGTGLGLFISKGIVESHGGRIWFETDPGHGTKFWVALPLSST